MGEIRHRNYKEFLAYWKGRVDLDKTNLFYRAILETLEEAAAAERRGQQVDASSIFDTSVKNAQVFADAVPEAR